MSPDRKFYLNDEHLPAWEGVDEEIFIGLGCYRSMLTTDKGKTLYALISPENGILGVGEGKIIIPLRVQSRKNKRKYNHPMKDIAYHNHVQFGQSNHLEVILKQFGVKREGENAMKKGEFSFSTYSTEFGDWHLVITRNIENQTNWRSNITVIDRQKAAAGLGEAFARKMKWSIEPVAS